MKNIFLLLALSMGLSSVCAQWREQLPSTQKKWRIGLSGGLGFGNNNYFSGAIAPTIGYDLGSGLEAGITAGYQYSGNKFYSYNLFSGGPYAMYSVIPELFIRANYEYYTGTEKFKSTGIKAHIDESALWLGIGYQSHGPVALRAGVMYNVLHKENNSIFSSALRPFAGVVFGL